MEELKPEIKSPEQIMFEFLTFRKPACDPILDAKRRANWAAREVAEIDVAQQAGNLVLDQPELNTD